MLDQLLTLTQHHVLYDNQSWIPFQKGYIGSLMRSVGPPRRLPAGSNNKVTNQCPFNVPLCPILLGFVWLQYLSIAYPTK